MARHLPNSYEALLSEVLPQLDDGFVKRNKPVHERASSAAHFIVEHMLVSIEGDSKDDYLTKPWFAGIYLPIIKWYEQRYGAAITHPKHPHARAMVSYLGTLYTMQIPLVLTESGDDGTRWVRFPKEVLPTEQPLEWIDSPPPVSTMKPKRRETFCQTVVHVANRLRAINNDLNTATHASKAVQRMASTVVRHLDKAAIDSASADLSSNALAPWELQMACEKTMKAYLSQTSGGYPETHDLRALHKLAERTLNWQGGKKTLAAFPSERRVIKWRYAELPAPLPTDLWRMYEAAIELCCAYSSGMSRKFVFNNFALQLRRAPWH